MTIKVTIEVPDAKIGKLLSQLDGFKALCEHVPVAEPKKLNGTKQHSRKDSLLTMTGKIPQKNSSLAKALTVFEKLEARKGIGTITLGDFRDELAKKKMDRKIAMRCVVEKVVKYL